MPVNTRMVTTANGIEYELARPNLAVRGKYLDFAQTINAFESSIMDVEDPDAASVQQATSDLIESLIDLLVFWVARTCPDITRDRIMEDFDTADLPMIKALMENFDVDLGTVDVPTPNRAERRASARAKTVKGVAS